MWLALKLIDQMWMDNCQFYLVCAVNYARPCLVYPIHPDTGNTISDRDPMNLSESCLIGSWKCIRPSLCSRLNMTVSDKFQFSHWQMTLRCCYLKGSTTWSKLVVWGNIWEMGELGRQGNGIGEQGKKLTSGPVSLLAIWDNEHYTCLQMESFTPMAKSPGRSLWIFSKFQLTWKWAKWGWEGKWNCSTLEVDSNLVALDWQSLTVTLEGYYYYYYSWNGVIMILIETSWIVAHGGWPLSSYMKWSVAQPPARYPSGGQWGFN